MLTQRDAENQTLIDQLLADQRSLTAVAQFSRRENGHISRQDRFYRDLIPLNAPRPGEQYAFEVNLDKCSGCKACVTACHNLNELDENETWRSVGSLHGGSTFVPLQLNVTTACHHCVDPSCLNGCPALAYEKNPITGVVRHIADHCIGCQYCILKCPYEVPQFQPKRGIVRKCDMCSDRLAAGEPPACVQSCPSEAIRIVIVDQKQIVATTTSETRLVPSAPKSNYTFPSTRYETTQPLVSSMDSADTAKLTPAKSHPSLVFMLVLTQLSVGMFSAAAIVPGLAANSKKQNAVALLFGFAGLTASVFHLGQPLRAWRAVLNLRQSWLSREVGLFALFASLATALAVMNFTSHTIPGLQLVVAVAGLLSVFASAMIYIDTRRDIWTAAITLPKFFGSTAILGASGSFIVAAFEQGISASRFFALSLIALTIAKLVWEAHALKIRNDRPRHQNKSALLLTTVFRWQTAARFGFGIVGGIALPMAELWLRLNIPVLAVASGVLSLSGELLERHLFFSAASNPKMPGGVGA